MSKFIIIVPAYNCKDYIETCLISILSQDYKNYILVVIDDGSTDGTSDIIEKIYRQSEKKFLIHKNPVNIGSPLASFIQGIKLGSTEKEDILVTVDGDDWLSHNKVLSYLNQIYQNKNICLTYGQFEPLSHAYHNLCQPLQNTRTYRNYRWVTSHLRTFKRKVFDLIKDEDLRDKNGNYYSPACDLAIMYPLIEMCGLKRIQFINTVLYIYNDLNPLNDMKIREQEQLDTANEIRNKPVYKELKTI